MRYVRLSLAVALASVTSCREATAPANEEILSPGETSLSWANVGKSCLPSSPATPLPPDLAMGFWASSYRNYNDELADLARVVPGGFGGMLYKNGAPYFYLVAPDQKTEAVAALNTSSLAFPWSSAQVIPGRWDFAQMYDWYRYINKHLTAAIVVRTTDVDEGNNRLTYGVADADARAKLEQLLTTLDVPCYLVAIKEVPPIRELSKRLLTPVQRIPSGR